MSKHTIHKPKYLTDTHKGAFMDLLHRCKRKDVILYHTGPHLEGCKIAGEVRKAQEAGLVVLVQRRVRGVSTGLFDYLAQKC